MICKGSETISDSDFNNFGGILLKGVALEGFSSLIPLLIFWKEPPLIGRKELEEEGGRRLVPITLLEGATHNCENTSLYFSKTAHCRRKRPSHCKIFKAELGKSLDMASLSSSSLDERGLPIANLSKQSLEKV